MPMPTPPLIPSSVSSPQGWVNWLADGASIFGFVVSLYVAWQVKRLRNQYANAGMLSTLSSKITELASDLIRCLENYDQSQDTVDITLAKMDTQVRAVKERLPRRKQQRALELISKIETYRKGSHSAERVQFIYTLVTQVITEVENLEEERKWRM